MQETKAQSGDPLDEKDESPQPTRKSTRKRKSTMAADQVDVEFIAEHTPEDDERFALKLQQNAAGIKKKPRKFVADVSNYSAIITDIEGTTTPISFVKDVLFPYARLAVASFLERNWSSEETQADIEALRAQAKDDQEKGLLAYSIPTVAEAAPEIVRAATVAYVQTLMNADRKVTALKALQGHIWREGYAAGQLKGELFADVPDALRAWHNRGIKLYVYSSGSIEAQKLLFGYTRVGSLLNLFSGHFDTTTGDKKSPASYSAIVNAIGLAATPNKALFLTDVHAEAVAAKTAGLDTVILIREGNAPLPGDTTFLMATSFEDFKLGKAPSAAKAAASSAAHAHAHAASGASSSSAATADTAKATLKDASAPTSPSKGKKAAASPKSKAKT